MSRKRKKNQWQMLRVQAEAKEAAEKKRTRATRFNHLSADSQASIFSALPLSSRPAIASLSAASRQVVDGRAYWNAYLKRPAMADEDPRQIFRLHPDRRARDVAIDAAGKTYVENILRGRLKSIFPSDFVDGQPFRQFLPILYEQSNWMSIDRLIQHTLAELLVREMRDNPDHFCRLHPGQDDVDTDSDEDVEGQELIGFVAGGALDSNLVWLCKQSHPVFISLNQRGLVAWRDMCDYSYSEWSQALSNAARPEVLPWLVNGSINIHDVAEQGLDKCLAAIATAQNPMVKPWVERGEFSLSYLFEARPDVVVATAQCIRDNKRIKHWVDSGGLSFANVLDFTDEEIERWMADAERLAADPALKPWVARGLIKSSVLFDPTFMRDEDGRLCFTKLRAMAAKLVLAFPIVEAVAEPRAAIAP